MLDEINYKGKNVYWFLIDGLSPDYLNICGNTTVQSNFFDEILSNSILFSNVASAGASTHTSMHSIFSSMLPTYNGANGWNKESLRKFDENLYTITDYFKEQGYMTFRYDDTLDEREVPMSGFHIWESSGVPICDAMYASNDTLSFPRRDRFIELVSKCKMPRFVYYHMGLLHELNCKMGSIWESQKYAKNIQLAADDFKDIYRKYEIKKDDIVIISSDHGVVLDIDFIRDGIDNGERHYEQSVKTFFSISGSTIKGKRFDQLISSLDEGPTIVDIILNEIMVGQGESRRGLIEEGNYKSPIIYREKGTFCADERHRTPYSSDVYYIRSDNWKYVYGINDNRCEWLIDLEKDGDYKKNRKDDEPEIVSKFRELIFNKFMLRIQDRYEDDLHRWKKRQMPPYFSVVVNDTVSDDATERSILDLAGPYYELIYVNGDTTAHKNKSYMQKYVFSIEAAKDAARGEYIVEIEGDREYSEYFLSDIAIEILLEQKKIINYRGEGFHVYHNSIKNDEHKNAVFKETIRCYKNSETSLEGMIKTGLIPYKYLFKKFCDYLLMNGNKGLNQIVFGTLKKALPELNIISRKIEDNDKMIIFPYGNYGKQAKEYFGKQVVFLADRSSKLVGTDDEGIKVLSPEDMVRKEGYDIFVAISPNNAYEILKYLNDIGCKKCILNYDYLVM